MLHRLHFLADVWLLFHVYSSNLAYKRWLHPSKKNKRNHQSNPYNEAKKTQQIDGRQLSNTFLPKLFEVAHHTDCKKSHHEKDTAKGVGFGHCGSELGC